MHEVEERLTAVIDEHRPRLPLRMVVREAVDMHEASARRCYPEVLPAIAIQARRYPLAAPGRTDAGKRGVAAARYAGKRRSASATCSALGVHAPPSGSRCRGTW